jgi:hypothetical protein
VLTLLLRQPHGFEGRCPIHIALDANHPSSTHGNDECRVGLQFDSAASTAAVFVQEHDNVVASVDELLCLQAPLFPGFQILRLERLVDLGLTVGYLALLQPADGPAELDLGSTSCAIFSWSPPRADSKAARTISTFSCDIAYSDSPTAASASLRSKYSVTRTTSPSS